MPRRASQPSSLLNALYAVRRRIVGLGLNLLYNELAWLYDPVSWLASLGRWRRWQASACLWLPPAGRVLEVGCGPGHVLEVLALEGFQTFGLEASPSMLRLAHRRLTRRELGITLIRGNAGTLPIAPDSFDALVVTFPTAFVYHAEWARHAARVLTTGGRLIVVEMASVSRHTVPERCLGRLYRAAGLRGTPPDLPGLLNSAGLAAWRETARLDGSTVHLVLAEKREAGAPSAAHTRPAA